MWIVSALCWVFATIVALMAGKAADKGEWGEALSLSLISLGAFMLMIA